MSYLYHTSVSRCTGRVAHLSVAKEIGVVGDVFVSLKQSISVSVTEKRT